MTQQSTVSALKKIRIFFVFSNSPPPRQAADPRNSDGSASAIGRIRSPQITGLMLGS